MGEGKNIRSSNFELLRVFAAFLVMAVHANFGALGSPTPQEALDSGWMCIGRIFLQIMAAPCVNLFILISGYFGIRLRVKALLNFFFIVAFWRALILCGETFSGVPLSLTRVADIMNPMRVWFIREYFTLMLFSPFINAFCETATPRQLLRFVGYYYLLVFLGDQIVPLKAWGLFNGGYSFFAFVGLYLLGRCVRQHAARLDSLPKEHLLGMYFVMGALATVMLFLGLRFSDCHFLHLRLEYLALSYTSPLVLLASLALFVFFSRLHLQSRIVNRIALSAFAVFLAHSPSFYRKTIQEFSGNGFFSCLEIVVFMLVVYLATVAVDQIRLWWFGALMRLGERYFPSKPVEG